MKDSKETRSEFDEVLESVSPELRKAYEAKNLAGKDLLQANQTLKSARQLWQRLEVKQMFAYVVGLIVGFGSILPIIYLFPGPSSGQLFSCVVPLGILALVLHNHFRMEKKVEVAKEVSLENFRILEGFKKDVEMLNPTGVTVRLWNREAVWSMHTRLAVMVLDAQNKFDAIRKAERRDIHGILHLGNYIQEWDGRLGACLANAKRFGIENGRRELFKAAAEHIAETDAFFRANAHKSAS